MLKKDIRKALIETKEKKERLLIEETIIKSRIMMIVEDVNNFSKLPTNQKNKVSEKLLEEFIFLGKNGLINENFMDVLKGLFGNVFGRSAVETIAEPIINALLTKIGFKSNGLMKKTMVSFLTSNPSDLINAFTDCKLMTKLVMESFIEGLVMVLQQETDKGGFMYDYIRNTLGGLIKSSGVASGIEDKISGAVCGVFDKFSDKAQNVAQKLKTNLGGSIT
jgi:hypothetical protein